MVYVLVPLAALLASALTLFSGFGLGTLLMPVMAVFFPVDLAVALTAVVHLLNNLFKLALVGRAADPRAVLRFGVPAILAALAGAALLTVLADLPSLGSYELAGATFQLHPVKLAVAAVMALLAVVELLPAFERLQFDARWMPLGGLISGFFGGLSGHQGALRSAFLVRSGLAKEAFIGTGVVLACLVDVTRLSVYGAHFASAGLGENGGLLALATGAAFAGAFIGARLMKKVTIRTIQILVSGLLLLIAALLALGML